MDERLVSIGTKLVQLRAARQGANHAMVSGKKETRKILAAWMGGAQI
jgi:hypothetical protein